MGARKLTQNEKDSIGDIIDGTMDTINEFADDEDRVPALTMWRDILWKLGQDELVKVWDKEIEEDERCWRCNGPADEGECMDDCTNES